MIEVGLEVDKQELEEEDNDQIIFFYDQIGSYQDFLKMILCNQIKNTQLDSP